MRYTAIYPLLSALLMSASAMAHTFSTAYLEVFVYQQQPAMLWKVALHDLARAGVLPGQNDEQISWQHVLDSEQILQRYLTQHLVFSSEQQSCHIKTLASSEWQLQQLQRDLYLLLPLQVYCPTQDKWQLHYQALFNVESSHKLLLSWQVPGQDANAVLSAASPYYPAVSQ